MDIVKLSTSILSVITDTHLVLKAAMSIIIALYIPYTFLLFREIGVLSKLIEQTLTSPTIKILSYAHMAAAVGLFLYAVLVL